MQTVCVLSRRLTMFMGRISVTYGVSLPSQFCTQSGSEINSVQYHRVVDQTLDELTEYLEELPDRGVCHSDYDVHLADGVLTLQLGGDLGTYVINKQTPNRQIWLSSPISGPSRYDFLHGQWVYKHDSLSLHKRLSLELRDLLKTNIDIQYHQDIKS